MASPFPKRLNQPSANLRVGIKPYQPITSNKMNLEEQLKEAESNLKYHTDRLQLTPEYRAVVEEQIKIAGIKKALEEERTKAAQAKFEADKQAIIDAGFEIRTGHKTGASNHHDRTSNDGEPYTFLVVHNSRPQITEVFEWSSDISIYPEEFKGEWYLGHGETEEEAWEDAIDSWECLEPEELEKLTH